ncbi:hypothetical protein LZ575_19210 [Antarcticibacterium sp. 1MA-6-2]|uniref:hypothetical protein n=1 Tax=Antarcticibacterium sp. 1MA-6-2 TaxID=2908210 RepID=UPI001F1FDC2C|nr:hypothetical protein [Antarcticibacterium sp. 1MA-6-2]UJH90835.1 hypothetical protein LZ575_19210 [Antarcticibacterium sp. 1MA-6-2]
MKLYNALYKDFDDLFVGSSALSIILSSCLGSVAVMLILMNGHSVVQMVQLFFAVVVCMGYNTAVLAQLKHKLVFNSLLVSLAVSIILIFWNIIIRY